MRAAVLLLIGQPGHPACPPGVDPVAFGRALAEDVADLLGTLSDVELLIAATPGRRDDAEAVRWPGTVVIGLSEGDGPIKAAAVADGYDEVAVFGPDAPDLPALLAAKPFSGLSTQAAAVVPASNGGLIAVAVHRPAPGLTVDLGTTTLEDLRRQVPDLAVAPAWPRLRVPTDVARLDPALEGWDTTRALLEGRS